MKIYVVLNALPWEEFTITVTDNNESKIVRAASNEKCAGFMPIYWSEEAAREAFPSCQITSADVADDWHPMVRQAQTVQTEDQVIEAVE